jgi:PBP1b-binding outer membrane lipoprotein LpoB
MFAIIEFKMKKVFIITVIIFLSSGFLTGCVSTPAPKTQPSEEVKRQEKALAKKAEIIKLQEEVVKLCQKILDDTQIKLDNAQASLTDLANARQKLADAKIKLAQFQDRQDLVIEELQNLLQFYITTRGRLVEQLEAGKIKARELYELEIALIETNIRLSQAVLEIAPSGVNRL